jgi:hypothetical protein
MQRIAEKHQPGEIERRVGRDLRGDPAAHRFAADRELVAADPITHRVDHRPVTDFQPIVTVRYAAAVFGVEKVECDRLDAAFGKLGCEAHHEGVALIRASAVTEDQTDARGVARAGGIEQGCYLVGRRDIDLDGLGHLAIEPNLSRSPRLSRKAFPGRARAFRQFGARLAQSVHRVPHAVFERRKLARRCPGAQFGLQQLPDALALCFGGRVLFGQSVEVTISAHATHSG